MASGGRTYRRILEAGDFPNRLSITATASRETARAGPQDGVERCLPRVCARQTDFSGDKDALTILRDIARTVPLSGLGRDWRVASSVPHFCSGILSFLVASWVPRASHCRRCRLERRSPGKIGGPVGPPTED